MTFRLIDKKKLQALEQYIPTETLKELINPDIDMEDHIADAKVNYATPGLDTEAEVIVAINATNTTINSILSALESYGILRST